MFTGIIEEIGSIAQIRRAGQTLQMTVNARKILKDINLGDSIAVNGVCLTVTSYNQTSFTVDVMPITYQDTDLSNLASGSLVNLERALAANGRFGGHIVSGHIDGVGLISAKQHKENAVIYNIQIDKSMADLCTKKGSIAIDGTSLTIMDCGDDWVQISIIPHTQDKSIIGSKKIGNKVNVECDILAKQIAQISHKQKNTSKIDTKFLKEHGFL